MAEFTLLDAPETPAPVFAFRALRGVIFGSPTDDDERNNENTKPPTQIPSLRSKISALMVRPPVSPSKRRKTNQHASPAKSILRTPGIPTPRRMNANVTFKDITPSLSPELTRKASKVETGPLPESVKRIVVVTGPSAKEAVPARSAISAVVPKAPNKFQPVQQTIIPDQAPETFDIEAYKQSTEKEMKKLVRYGQKMREYARKQDEQNTKLRIALEELQKENEELRKRESLREAGREDKRDQGKTEKEAHREVVGGGLVRDTVREIEDKKVSTSVDERVNKMSTSTARHWEQPSKTTPPRNGRLSPLKRKASTQLGPESLPQRNAKAPDLAATTNSSTEEKVPASGPGTIRLPVDRVAAARERIRLKAELRRKTAAGVSSPVDWNAL